MTTTAAPRTEERYVAEFADLERTLPATWPPRLAEMRRAAIERFAELGFPHKKLEEWRSTDVSPVTATPFAPAPEATVEAGALADYDYPDCHLLVTVNGRLEPGLSRLDDLPDGVVVSGLAQALERSPELVSAHLGRHASFQEHPFVALNTALHRDGAFVHLADGVVVEKPIHLLSVAVPGGERVAFFPRNLIVAGESSQARMVEQYVTVGEGRYLISPVTEVVVGRNATVDHYKLQRESLEAYHLATHQLRQERDSNFSSHTISWGGAMVRNDVNAILAGEGCEGTLNGLYLVEGDQLVDNHMRVEHAAPHCNSHELYKGILEGRARAVFNGRIYVHEGAQKTDAKQTNRNLLLSPDALVNSNPQLEIFADDVKCTHGSTVGRLDDTAIFYLRSRGIGEEAAKSLLTYAFAADIVSNIRIEPVRRDLEEFLFRRLPKGDIVRQAV